MYHYVADRAGGRFAGIKGLTIDEFRRQVDTLRACYEMATLESALAFWRGAYQPDRDLCLLTFDDGLVDHYANVAGILGERGIQGVFFVVTRCLDDRWVAAVHKNHFLMAALGFEAYRAALLAELGTAAEQTLASLDMAAVRKAHRWDTAEVAAFKYLLNFGLTATVRDEVLDRLAARHLGGERELADHIYMTWEQAREMQRAGMAFGGHSHRHQALASLSHSEQEIDIESCWDLLNRRLQPQAFWPFAYPYGKRDTFSAFTTALLERRGFTCAFSTEHGNTAVSDELFALARIDAKSVETGLAERSAHA